MKFNFLNKAKKHITTTCQENYAISSNIMIYHVICKNCRSKLDTFAMVKILEVLEDVTNK